MLEQMAVDLAIKELVSCLRPEGSRVLQLTLAHMKRDVTADMKYCNLERLHTSNRDLSPTEYEKLAN